MVKLPANEAEWNIAAGNIGVRDQSIHDTIEVKSGSNVTNEQYYAFRVLWPEPIRISKHSFSYLTSQLILNSKNYNDAEELLENYRPLKEYRQCIETARHSTLGLFSLVYYYQAMCISIDHKYKSMAPVDIFAVVTPKVSNFSGYNTRSKVPLPLPFKPKGAPSTPTPQGRPATREPFDMNELNKGLNSRPGSISSEVSSGSRSSSGDRQSQLSSNGASPIVEYGSPQSVADEQIVNTALLLFLNAITLANQFIKQDTIHWSIERKRFRMGSSWEARTDGYLRDYEGVVKAIIEVKPFRRSRWESSIQMQEAAQMVAWIFSDENAPSMCRTNSKKEQRYSRLLVSQDADEIYLTIATYDTDYYNYIMKIGPPLSKLSFMEMQTYGPFYLRDVSTMSRLAYILMAFTTQEARMSGAPTLTQGGDPFASSSRKR